MENNSIIRFSNVSYRYESDTDTPLPLAIKDIDLDINKGEFVFVVGSSGAGKSTFMKLIMREEKANTGKILVNGTSSDNVGTIIEVSPTTFIS